MESVGETFRPRNFGEVWSPVRRSPSGVVRRSLWLVAVLLASAGASRPAAGQPGGSAPAAVCAAPGASIALDHVVVAVDDLEAAVARYERAGFTIKPGRPHPNGLLNAHVEFSGDTELELMSVPGPATDEIARGYRDFLRGGEGGAFAAFRALNDSIVPVARRGGVRADRLGGAYVVFPDLPHVFAIRPGRFRVLEPDSILAHANGATGIEEVWMEGGERLAALLLALGGRACGPVEPPRIARTRRPGRAFAVANGRVVLLPVEDPERPLVRGVVLRSGGETPESVSHDRAHGIWIGFERPEIHRLR